MPSKLDDFHPRRLLNTLQDYHNVTNVDSVAIVSGEVLAVQDDDGVGLLKVKKAKADAIATRDGQLLIATVGIAVGGVGKAVKGAVVSGDTSAASGTGAPMYLSGATAGAATATAPAVPRVVGRVLGTPDAAGSWIFDPGDAIGAADAPDYATAAAGTLTGERWIDGKPVYQRVYAIGAGGGAGVDVAIALGAAIDTLVGLSGYAEETGGEFYPLPASGDGTDTVECQLAAAKDTVNLVVSGGFDVVGGHLIVKYTKP